VPNALVQLSPQNRQLLLVKSVVSQFGFVISQFAKPVLHVVGRHTPVLHSSSEFGMLQLDPHALQFALVLSDDSQPLLGLESQALNKVGSSHVWLQPVVRHVSGPWAFEHSTPQPLQFRRVVMSVSQPFTSLPSQLSQPVSQLPRRQVPAGHDSPA
jgi:hypothetical protein